MLIALGRLVLLVDSVQNRIVHIHLFLMMLELLAQRGQLLGRESGYLCLLPQLVQFLVLEQALVPVRAALFVVVLRLVRLVLGWILQVLEMLQHAVRAHDVDEFLAQFGLFQAILVLVLAVLLFPIELRLVLQPQFQEERLELRLGEALRGVNRIPYYTNIYN